MTNTNQNESIREFSATDAPLDMWGIQGQAGWYYLNASGKWMYCPHGKGEAEFNARMVASGNGRTK